MGKTTAHNNARRQVLNAVEKRLIRLKALRTELQNLGMEGAAEEVGEEITCIEALPSAADNPAVAEFLGAVMDLEKDLEKGMNDLEHRGGRR